jgi:hypothetical protein
MSQTTDDTWTLLSRVGLTRTGGSFDALADPAATDALAALLAERLLPCEPDVVVVWEGLQSVVLGYAVGLRLGVPVVVLSDDEGLVDCATPIIADTRAALVAATTPDASMVRMAASYLEDQDGELVATATLLAQPGSVGGAVTVAQLPPGEPTSGALPRRDVSLAPDQTLRQDWR